MEISEENNRMIRNLIVLGCTALLTIGLSFGAFAGAAPDSDADGVPDAYDNCIDTQNGPTASLYPGCAGQQDYAGNGYGQPCDQDVNHDGAVGLDDVGDVLTALGTGGAALDADFNCDGGVGLDDLGDILNALSNTPGPSGLVCAGPSSTGCVAS
jgi:hypothetical protein